MGRASVSLAVGKMPTFRFMVLLPSETVGQISQRLAFI